MDTRLRMYLAELFGTFVVVLIGAGTICASYLPAADPRFYTVGGITLAAALAEGFALAIAVSATCYLSIGCCNPAITLALFVTRKLDGGRTFLLIAMQLLGAFLAGLTLRGLFDDSLLVEARMGSPHLKALLGPGGTINLNNIAAGAGVEFLLTFILTIAAFTTLIDRRAPRMGGLGLGLAQVCIVLFGFHLTGGAANPARYFGTAVWQLTLSMPPDIRPMGDHPVYWVGPIFGALAGSVFYTLVLMPEGRT
jgi:glycerol uptake facilitator-like aquaporin